MIIVDSREASESASIVRELSKAASVEVRALEAGDYYIVGEGREALVERKTVNDFLQSIKGRIWDQLSSISSFYGEKLILLEGYLAAYRKRGWNEKSVLALMDSIVNEWKVPIIYVPDKRATISYLLWKDKSLGKPKERKEHPLRVKSKEMSVEEQSLYVMEGLCGHETAKALLNHFGSLGDVISFLRGKLSDVLREFEKVKVRGRRVPENVAKRMHSVVNCRFSKSLDQFDD